jgi:hypothetical protein
MPIEYVLSGNGGDHKNAKPTRVLTRITKLKNYKK